MIDVQGTLRAGRVLASHAGMSLVTHTEEGYWTTPNGAVYVPIPQLDWTPIEVASWYNGISHEVGHWHPNVRDIFPVLTSYQVDTSSVAGALLNITDDLRNDRNRTQMYPGTSADYVKTLDYHIRKGWCGKAQDPAKMTEPNQIVHTMLGAMLLAAGVEHDEILSTYAAFAAGFTDKQDSWATKIVDDGWIKRWLALDSAEGEYTFVREIMRDVFEVPEEDLPPEEPPGKGGDEEGDDEGDEPCDEGEDGNTPGEGEEGEEKPVPSKEKVTIPYDEVLSAHSKDWQRKTTDKETGMQSIDYSDYTAAGYQPHTDDTNKIGYPEDIFRNGTISPDRMAGVISHYEDYMQRSGVESVARKARKYLQAITRRQYNTNQKRGRLDTRKLTKLVTHRNVQGELPLYKQRSQLKEIDTAVYILVDASGSMGSDKYPLAVAAAYGMATICKASAVPCEIAAFTEADEEVNYHGVFKTFGEKLVKQDFLRRASIMGFHKACNADCDNILVAYNRLIKRKEARKMIIVMSDGCPAGYRGDAYTYTCKAVQEIEKRSPIDILGVGILDANVKRIYTTNYVVENLSDIPTALIEVLKENITLR